MDENNRYLRASFKDLESISIETPSTKILEQLSKTGFQIRIISKDKKEVLSLIQSVNEGGISVQNESDPNPVLIPKEEIASVFYRANEKKAEPPPKEKEIQPITILDYLIPGYYIKNQGYTKSGYTLMGAAAFFAIGSIYEFIEAKNSEGKNPLFVPQGDGSILWIEQPNGEFNKHKNLNTTFSNIFNLHLYIQYRTSHFSGYILFFLSRNAGKSKFTFGRKGSENRNEN